MDVSLFSNINLLGRISGCERFSIDIDNRFLSAIDKISQLHILSTFFSPKVDPEDVFLISILLEDWLETLLKTINGGLTCAKDGESRELKEIFCF